MGRPDITLNADHLRVTLSGMDAVAAVSRGFVVPYSTIKDVEVGAPEWPPALKTWGGGLRAPPFVLKGWVGDKPWGPFDRFFFQEKGTASVLRLRLENHPRFREVHLAVADPDTLAKDLKKKL